MLSTEWLSEGSKRDETAAGQSGYGEALLAQASAQGKGGGAVTGQAESADIVEVAFPAAFDDRNNVVGIPEAFASPLA